MICRSGIKKRPQKKKRKKERKDASDLAQSVYQKRRQKFLSDYASAEVAGGCGGGFQHWPVASLRSWTMGASKESAPARLGSLIKWNSIVPFLVSLILMGILWRQMVHWSSPNSPWLSRSVPQSVYATTEALFSGGSSVFPPTRSRAFHCSDAQRFGQAAAWRALFDEKKVLVSCADSIYMGFVREFLQTQSPVLVNVGANKGYGIMHWLLAFDSTFEFSLKDVYNMYEERFPGLPRLCGVCRDCEEAPGRSTSLASNSDTDMTPTLSRKPVIYAFEPAINNSMVLSALEEMIQYPTLEVIHAAASNVTGKLYFTGCAAGQETCHLVMRPMKDALEIDVTTIDEFLRMRKIPKVDILKIDAEG